MQTTAREQTYEQQQQKAKLGKRTHNIENGRAKKLYKCV